MRKTSFPLYHSLRSGGSRPAGAEPVRQMKSVLRALATATLAALLLPHGIPAQAAVDHRASAAPVTPGPQEGDLSLLPPPGKGLPQEPLFDEARATTRWTSATSPGGEGAPATGVPAGRRHWGEYRGEGFTFTGEMGELRLRLPGTEAEQPRSGGRFLLQTGSGPCALRLESFALTGAGPGGEAPSLSGGSGELSLLSGGARLKAFYLQQREAALPAAEFAPPAERRRELLGVLALLEPLPGALAAEGEIDVSRLASSGADQDAASRDLAYRLRMGGAVAKLQYEALYRYAGPDYRGITGAAGDRDNGIRVRVAGELQPHTVELRLSRFQDSAPRSEAGPRYFRSRAELDYSCTGIPSLPLGLRYRRVLLERSGEPGLSRRKSDSDLLGGSANLLVGRWDLGVKGEYTQRWDRVTETRELVSHSLGLSPRYLAPTWSVAPELTLGQARDFPGVRRTQSTAFNLQLAGGGTNLDYRLKGGYSRETSSPISGRESFGVALKLNCDLARLLRRALLPSLGVKGEFTRVAPWGAQTEGWDHYALLLQIGSGFPLF